MAYAVTRRRFPARLAGTYPVRLGQYLSDGFDWGSFATSIGTSAAQSVAAAGVTAIDKAIIGAATPGAAKPAFAPAAVTASLTPSSIPIYVWALGGLGLVLVLVMAMRR